MKLLYKRKINELADLYSEQLKKDELAFIICYIKYKLLPGWRCCRWDEIKARSFMKDLSRKWYDSRFKVSGSYHGIGPFDLYFTIRLPGTDYLFRLDKSLIYLEYAPNPWTRSTVWADKTGVFTL